MIRPQYHFRNVQGRVHIWDVRKLAVLAADLPITEHALSAIREIHEPYWFSDDTPTCARVMEHAAQVATSDLAYPVILCAEGRIMDGMHRVMKARGLGHTTIKARQLTVTPPPNFIDVAPKDLPYADENERP